MIFGYDKVSSGASSDISMRPGSPATWSPAGACPTSSGRCHMPRTRRRCSSATRSPRRKNMSEETAQAIDKEIRGIVEEGYASAPARSSRAIARARRPRPGAARVRDADRRRDRARCCAASRCRRRRRRSQLERGGAERPREARCRPPRRPRTSRRHRAQPATGRLILVSPPGLDRVRAAEHGSPAAQVMPEVAEIYIRPPGTHRRRGRSRSRRGRLGVALGGGPAAFTACEIWRRGAQGIIGQFIPAADLAGWLDRQPERDACPRGAALSIVCARRPAGRMGLPERRPLIMGVVNVTPDSFSDGGQSVEPAAAIAHGLRLHAEGADILDVGGEFHPARRRAVAGGRGDPARHPRGRGAGQGGRAGLDRYPQGRA